MQKSYPVIAPKPINVRPVRKETRSGNASDANHASRRIKRLSKSRPSKLYIHNTILQSMIPVKQGDRMVLEEYKVQYTEVTPAVGNRRVRPRESTPVEYQVFQGSNEFGQTVVGPEESLYEPIEIGAQLKPVSKRPKRVASGFINKKKRRIRLRKPRIKQMSPFRLKAFTNRGLNVKSIRERFAKHIENIRTFIANHVTGISRKKKMHWLRSI